MIMDSSKTEGWIIPFKKFSRLGVNRARNDLFHTYIHVKLFSRYLFINCRPWVGDIDRTDPWATPDLSPNIEVRIIDLCTLKDVGVRYKGHKGFSPPNMCCFVFLDVSQDFVAR